MPPVANQFEDFKSVVHNIAGNISVFQQIVFASGLFFITHLLPRQICMLNNYSYLTSLAAHPLKSIKPHPAQTSGNIFMDQEGGVAKAVCAAYKDNSTHLQYYVCRIPNGMTAEEAACLYYPRNLTCPVCTFGSKSFNTTISTSVSDRGIKTDSCRLNIWVEGLYMCLAQRMWWNGSVSRVQHIGNFTISKVPSQPISNRGELGVLLFLEFAVPVIASLGLIVLILVCVCACTKCCGLWKCKKSCLCSIKHENSKFFLSGRKMFDFQMFRSNPGPSSVKTYTYNTKMTICQFPLMKVMDWARTFGIPHVCS